MSRSLRRIGPFRRQCRGRNGGAACEGCFLDFGCPKPIFDDRGNRVRLEPFTAGENIHRGKMVLGPRMNGDMGFRNNDDSADTVGLEGVKGLRDHGAFARHHGAKKEFADLQSVLEICGHTATELDKRVLPKGSQDASPFHGWEVVDNNGVVVFTFQMKPSRT